MKNSDATVNQDRKLSGLFRRRSMFGKIRVLEIRPEDDMRVKTLRNDMAVLQSKVDGYVEKVRIVGSTNLIILCNEEGRIRNLPFCRFLVNPENHALITSLYGDIIVCAVGGNGDFRSLTDADIEWLKKEEAITYVLRPVRNA